MAKAKNVYYFGKTRTDGGTEDKQLLGGKGANLADMTSIGLPVPPGFTITTEVCDKYYRAGEKLPAGLMKEVNATVKVSGEGTRQGDEGPQESVARVRSIGCCSFDAGDDEHDPKSGAQRQVGGRTGGSDQ